MFRIAMLVAMTICSISANAASWKFLNGVYGKKLVGYFDADTIVKKGDTVTIWIKYVNEPNTPDSDGSYSTAQRAVYSCKKRTYQVLTTSIYDKSQQFIRSFTNPGKEIDITPDSFGEYILNDVCKADFPKGATPVKNNDVFAATYDYYAYTKDSNVDFSPHSTNWFAFNSVANESIAYYFEADSVVRNADIVTLWVKYVSNPNSSNSFGVYSAAVKYDFDCSKKMLQLLMSSSYDKETKFMSSSSVPGTKETPTAGTLADGLLQAVCSNNFPNVAQSDLYFAIQGGDIYAAATRYFDYIKAKKSDPAPK